MITSMMNSVPLYLALALMLAAAILTVITDRLLTAVIYAGALSTFAALGYLLLGAPDVALAEIAVGATLATVIFLVTLKKYRIFTVYLVGFAGGEDTAKLVRTVERALEAYELEPHLLHAQENIHTLLAQAGCDLVIELRDHTLVLHREESSQHMQQIIAALQAEGFTLCVEDSLGQSASDYREEAL